MGSASTVAKIRATKLRFIVEIRSSTSEQK